MITIMLGAPGTGKGTVAGILSEQTGWPQISTEDIFRKNISEKTELRIETNLLLLTTQSPLIASMLIKSRDLPFSSISVTQY